MKNQRPKTTIHITVLVMILFAHWAVAQNTQEDLHACVIEQFEQGDGAMTLAEVRRFCEDAQQQATDTTSSSQSVDESNETRFTAGIITSRFIKERSASGNPFILTPHKMNYILPAYTTDAINRSVYAGFNGYEDNIEDLETKFQISLKVPLLEDDLLFENDGLYFGFTIEAWWQVYSSKISKPFRETNYQPELFYLTPMKWRPFGGNTGLAIGIEHQSNGRGQGLSRSWNRVYANFLYEKDRFAFSLRPWARLDEDDKDFIGDPEGDDNPDIEDFMGHFELGMVYKWDHIDLIFKGRQNFSTNNGYRELGMTFPFFGQLRGYAVLSDGYGDSLIDYNYDQTRFGVGFTLNDVF